MSKTPETDKFYASFKDGVATPNQEEWLDHCMSVEVQLSDLRGYIESLRHKIADLKIEDGIDNFSKGRNATIDAVLELMDIGVSPEVQPPPLSELGKTYVPEVWPMLKDWIYDAQLAIDTGIENSEELLAEKDERVGRTIRSNRLVAERMEHEIHQMKKALENIKRPAKEEDRK